MDFDPDDGLALGDDPRDVVSEANPLLALAVRRLAFDGGADHDTASAQAVGLGEQCARILYDNPQPPPEAGRPEEDAAEAVLRWIEVELRLPTGSMSIK
ncbi:MAG: hypothetical protein GY715_13200 [Planctomycetes bacterium]|nr:hypothetical protein [Planctomycetota bacterium]